MRTGAVEHSDLGRDAPAPMAGQEKI